MANKPSGGCMTGLAEMMEACRVAHLNTVETIKANHEALIALKDFADVLREACGPSMLQARPDDVPDIADLLTPDMEDSAWLDKRAKIMRNKNCLSRLYAYATLLRGLKAKLDECQARTVKLEERIKGDSGAEAQVAVRLKGKLARIIQVLDARRKIAAKCLMVERQLVVRSAITNTVVLAECGLDREWLAMMARHYNMARQVELLDEENGKMLKGKGGK